jgi:hypothetical protein
MVNYQPLYVATDRTITSVENSTNNIQFCESNNKINTISVNSLVNKNINEDLNLSAFDGTTINPIIKINNTNNNCTITSNLNCISNVNVSGNLNVKNELLVSSFATSVDDPATNFEVNNGPNFTKMLLKTTSTSEKVELAFKNGTRQGQIMFKNSNQVHFLDFSDFDEYHFNNHVKIHSLNVAKNLNCISNVNVTGNLDVSNNLNVKNKLLVSSFATDVHDSNTNFEVNNGPNFTKMLLKTTVESEEVELAFRKGSKQGQIKFITINQGLSDQVNYLDFSSFDQYHFDNDLKIDGNDSLYTNNIRSNGQGDTNRVIRFHNDVLLYDNTDLKIEGNLNVTGGNTNNYIKYDRDISQFKINRDEHGNIYLLVLYKIKHSVGMLIETDGWDHDEPFIEFRKGEAFGGGGTYYSSIRFRRTDFQDARIMFTYSTTHTGVGTSFKAYIDLEAKSFVTSFTGQHRCVPANLLYYNNIEDYVGMIVYATGKYKTYNSINDILYENKNAITINDSLPIVELTNTRKCKSVFGVISAQEELDRHYSAGAFQTPISNKYDDKRIYVNSIGEGAMWVVNTNGNLENGDYIQSSNITGYGEKQNSEFLANYTVAKITCDCEFDLNSNNYNCVSFSVSGVIYIKAFVGVSYHHIYY